jgi:hypothetical protein
MLDPKFWLLSYTGDGLLGLEEPELRSRDVVAELEEHSVVRTWVPPKFKVVGDGMWPDWMHYPVPFLSDQALELLKDLIEPHCQLLPVFLGAGHRYNLLNVLTQVSSGSWSCEESSRYGDVIASAEGITISVSPPPDIFRLEGLVGRYFVSDVLAKRSYDAQLTGALFIDPSVRSMNLPFIERPAGASKTAFVRRPIDIPN